MKESADYQSLAQYDEQLQACVARAQETKRKARAAKEEAAQARARYKGQKAEYQRLKKLAKKIRHEADEAQQQLQRALDEAFRKIAESMQVSAANARPIPAVTVLPNPNPDAKLETTHDFG